MRKFLRKKEALSIKRVTHVFKIYEQPKSELDNGGIFGVNRDDKSLFLTLMIK